jgi:hypothetical protein
VHPPAWVCESLVRQAPLLRLGWAGRAPTQAGALNCGTFALVSLYPAATYWNEELRNKFFREFWSMTCKQLPFGDKKVKQVGFVHFERGPVFNRKGSVAPDYDPLARIPVYMQDLDFEQVMTGRVSWQIPLARKIAAQTMKERRQAEQERKEKTLKDAQGIIDSAARDIANEQWYNANKTGMAGTQNLIPDYSHIRAIKEGDPEACLTTGDIA